MTHFRTSCSTLPVIALSHAQGGTGSPGVSQNINTVFHAPASLYVFLSRSFPVFYVPATALSRRHTTGAINLSLLRPAKRWDHMSQVHK